MLNDKFYSAYKETRINVTLTRSNATVFDYPLLMMLVLDSQNFFYHILVIVFILITFKRMANKWNTILELQFQELRVCSSASCNHFKSNQEIEELLWFMGHDWDLLGISSKTVVNTSRKLQLIKKHESENLKCRWKNSVTVRNC